MRNNSKLPPIGMNVSRSDVPIGYTASLKKVIVQKSKLKLQNLKE